MNAPNDSAWLDVSDTAVFDAIVNEIERTDCKPLKCTLALSHAAMHRLSMSHIIKLSMSFKSVNSMPDARGPFEIVEDPV